MKQERKKKEGRQIAEGAARSTRRRQGTLGPRRRKRGGEIHS